MFFSFWRDVENKQTNHFLMQRLKIKGNLIRIRLLLHCSIRMMQGSDVTLITHCSRFSHVPNGCRERPAPLVTQPGQGLVSSRIQKGYVVLGRFQCMLPCFPKFSWKAHWGMLFHSKPAGPPSPTTKSWQRGQLLLPTHSPISDHRPAAWMKACCHPVHLSCYEYSKHSNCSWQGFQYAAHLRPPVFPNVFPTLGLSLLHAWLGPFPSCL